MLDNIRNQNVEGRYRETSDKRTNSSLIKVTSLLGLVYEKKMYNNYIFDLYGTLIDINTDEWNDDLWKKIAIFYATRVHTTHMTSLTRSMTDLFRLKKGCSQEISRHKSC